MKNIAYMILKQRIKHYLKNNDEDGIFRTENSLLFIQLTKEQKKSIINEEIFAVSEIHGRIYAGQLTPMVMKSRNKISGHTHFFIYLTRYLSKENPRKARQLALKAATDISTDTNLNLKYKEDLLNKYFKIYSCTVSKHQGMENLETNLASLESLLSRINEVLNR